MSRNAREGRYIGWSQGRHVRLQRQRKYLSATLTRMIRLTRYARRAAGIGIDLHADVQGWALL